MKDIFDVKKIGIFAGGLLFGTAGLKILSSKDAKKIYQLYGRRSSGKGLRYEDRDNGPGERRRYSF